MRRESNTQDLSAERKSEGFMYSEEKCGTINANSVTPQEWACAMLGLNASLANPWGRSLFQTAQYNSSRERTRDTEDADDFTVSASLRGRK